MSLLTGAKHEALSSGDSYMGSSGNCRRDASLHSLLNTSTNTAQVPARYQRTTCCRLRNGCAEKKKKKKKKQANYGSGVVHLGFGLDRRLFLLKFESTSETPLLEPTQNLR